jgi:hypothetical protein
MAIILIAVGFFTTSKLRNSLPASRAITAANNSSRAATLRDTLETLLRLSTGTDSRASLQMADSQFQASRAPTGLRERSAIRSDTRGHCNGSLADVTAMRFD